MTEIDYLKCKLKDTEKAFDKLHKRHMDLLKKQGELEKENKKLKEDKKILDSIKKRHNCLNCVKTIENYCLKHYKKISKDEICENYRYWR